MPNQEFFLERPQIHPTIYAYSLVGVASHNGYLKVGFLSLYHEEMRKAMD